MVVAEFSIVPAVGDSLRPYVRAAVSEIEKSGLNYEVGAMGTTLEGELDEVLEAIKKAHRAVLAKGAGRLVTSIKIDERKDGLSMQGKLAGFRDESHFGGSRND
ncbi:MAG: MTH1187 family thiamine-binding protein [Actinomycetota bacterium]